MASTGGFGSPQLSRGCNQRQSQVLQQRVKKLSSENDILRRQLREVLRERDRQLKEIVAEEAKKYEARIDQVKRQLREKKAKEVEMIKTNVSRDWGRRVDILAQSRDRESARVNNRLSLRVGLQEMLEKAKLDVTVLRKKLERAEQRISELDQLMLEARKETKSARKELEDNRRVNADEVKNIKAAYEHQKKKLEHDIQMKSARISELELELSETGRSRSARRAFSPDTTECRPEVKPPGTPELFRPCLECRDLRVNLKLAESEKTDAEAKSKEMETALLKAQKGVDSNSIVTALLQRVQQMEAEQDRLQAMITEAKDQNELLEFQLLERQEELLEYQSQGRDSWHHPYTILSPTPPSDDSRSVSEDEGIFFRDESSASSDSANENSPGRSVIRVTPKRHSGIPVAHAKLSDDLRIKFSLLRHRRTLRNEDRLVVAEVKKRWDALESELNKYKKSCAPITEEEARAGLGTHKVQTESEKSNLPFEKRQELAKLQYMLRASEDTEKRQKQCIHSLKQQLESLRKSREAEIAILSQSVNKYSSELETYRAKSGDLMSASFCGTSSELCDTPDTPVAPSALSCPGSTEKKAMTKSVHFALD